MQKLQTDERYKDLIEITTIAQSLISKHSKASDLALAIQGNDLLSRIRALADDVGSTPIINIPKDSLEVTLSYTHCYLVGSDDDYAVVIQILLSLIHI